MSSETTTERQAVLRFVDTRLESLCRRPEMWGSPESVELQALLLLEVRALILQPGMNEESLRAIQESYVRFLEAKFPGAPHVYLAEQLAARNQLGDFATILGEFVSEASKLSGRQGIAPLYLVDGPESGPHLKSAAGP